MKTNIKLFLFPFFLYLGIGVYYTKEPIIELIFLSLIFSFDIYLMYSIFYFFKFGTRVKAKVIKKEYAFSSGDDMTTTYHYYFKVKDKIYKPLYSYNFGPKEGKVIDVIIIDNNKNRSVIEYRLFFISIFYVILITSILFIFYYLQIG